ncbi:hypothetical protein TheveDRAFT_0938 [Thermanaerovibrio velox DSM 12556]|uniref:Uncharacterized protein n=2 Tax=Thermanaerovibrio TaxID=81461 RepID=H0URY5_9BACT|nr:hypothetical protein TheveDRAFT_0938 [Thermanaerovibrio velox DSM 12556]
MPLRMIRKKKESLLKQVLLVFIISLGAAILVMWAAVATVPPKIFRDNVILRLIYEKHTKAVHWFKE